MYGSVYGVSCARVCANIHMSVCVSMFYVCDLYIHKGLPCLRPLLLLLPLPSRVGGGGGPWREGCVGCRRPALRSHVPCWSGTRSSPLRRRSSRALLVRLGLRGGGDVLHLLLTWRAVCVSFCVCVPSVASVS